MQKNKNSAKKVYIKYCVNILKLQKLVISIIINQTKKKIIKNIIEKQYFFTRTERIWKKNLCTWIIKAERVQAGYR